MRVWARPSLAFLHAYIFFPPAPPSAAALLPSCIKLFFSRSLLQAFWLLASSLLFSFLHHRLHAFLPHLDSAS
ncbi:hypothetical protein B0T26DRAFT_723356 [Lasiosphaeria miniovina]|uniref:Uncharacterized protein n=1 Tax=Lasiosphaeria miniovina TaxID=1954250 RepID=A0AA40A5T5_9PEZI|nr:uncharacterized protein B0T26DRAFT_723356 [Lasiosphaeria miniovina]KAK0709868.1 hypothetical protein B0T26DRAFT_723356 [Lasiosphaeria miniovina]